MQKMPSKMEVAPQCTQKLKWEERWSGFENFLLFWFSGIFRKFSRNFEFSRILEKFHFSISISRHFHFTFHFSKRVNQIFISLFTSRKEWIRFSFHFSLLEKSETDFHFTFHFSNFQYPLSQDTAMAKVQLACFRISFISPKPYLSVLESHLRIINPDPD